MNKPELVKQMKMAVEQHQRLKKHSELMEARLSGFDDALRLLGARVPETGMGYAEDHVYALDKMADHLDAEFQRENQREAPRSK